jgi:hypothetical protein
MTAPVAPRLAEATTPPRPAPSPAAPWDGAEAPPAPPRLVSLYAPAPGHSAAAFVRAARGVERFYWAEPGDGLVLAGAGVAAHLIAAPVLPDDAVERQSGAAL